jgi:hypothetical protein
VIDTVIDNLFLLLGFIAGYALALYFQPRRVGWKWPRRRQERANP